MDGMIMRKKKIIMDEAVYRTYVQAHPKEEPSMNKPIEKFEEMFLVCGEAASVTYSKSGRSVSSLGNLMEASPIPTPNDINDVGLENYDFFGTENNVMGNENSPELQNVNSSTPTRIISTPTKMQARREKEKKIFKWQYRR